MIVYQIEGSKDHWTSFAAFSAACKRVRETIEANTLNEHIVSAPLDIVIRVTEMSQEEFDALPVED